MGGQPVGGPATSALRGQPVMLHRSSTRTGPVHRLTGLLSVMVSAGCLGGAFSFSTVSAAPQWAPASSAKVHPGVQLLTNGAQCTANFIFTNDAHVYVGQAAHCSGLGANSATDGCTSPSLPLGTPVEIPGATRPGKIVYSSWLTMQGLHETDPSS